MYQLRFVRYKKCNIPLNSRWDLCIGSRQIGKTEIIISWAQQSLLNIFN